MFKKSKLALLATFAIIIVAMAPASAILGGYAQPSIDSMAEKIVDIAQNANVQVDNLIDSIYSDDQTLQKIADTDLTEQLDGNVTVYNQGAILLAEAESALENDEYETAVSKAREALQVFRQVYRSVNWILIDAGLRTSQYIDSYGLLDAVTRTLNRIEHLREVLPFDAVEQIALLDQAEALLNLQEIESLIMEGKILEAADNLRQAKELISQVYEYLKLQAEESNSFRIRGYLEEMTQARERLRERFRYAGGQGLSLDEVFQLLGYRNEIEFMNALQNMTQNAQGKVEDFSAAIVDLEALGQLIQQMDQALTQEMNRHQYQYGSEASGSGSGGYGQGTTGSSSGSTSTDNSYGGNGPGYGATSGAGIDSGPNSDVGTGGGSSGTGTIDNGAGTSGAGTSGAGTTAGGYMGPGGSGAGTGYSTSGSTGSGGSVGGNGP